jgi:thiol-disulfide isomerase/thioredoxin
LKVIAKALAPPTRVKFIYDILPKIFVSSSIQASRAIDGESNTKHDKVCELKAKFLTIPRLGIICFWSLSMKFSHVFFLLPAFVMLFVFTASAQNPPKSPTLGETYPGLANGALIYATLGDLPEGVLMKVAGTEITKETLQKRLEAAPESVREEIKKNAFVMLEQISTEPILIELVKQSPPEAKKDAPPQTDMELIRGYIKGLLEKITVSDDEIAEFYNQRKDSFSGASFEQMKENISSYLLKEKRGNELEKTIKNLGRQIPTVVSAAWAKEQDAVMSDNSLDRARRSGKPTMVEFWSETCPPCKLMKPIIEELSKTYEGKVNVISVNVNEEKIMTIRYGVSPIPVQAFFDKNGQEVFRHVGYFEKELIEKKFAELGAQ